ncbi:MAG: hypothetical protein GFH27_549279n211 [Chloroflexi bacterium AL-W]|nr:hypothetical protein [Chloroflexi bacterium AL-N1]NOK65177.1 hypothetical protein [Chloroflexi bacterium AL-N10]NOK72557.1 hypothetical protein [Chloroflexi bacterium AL-N5]NOK79356.1 hypothetical protein [Chloroflexi bacterium AL-W]NOK87272.1 hypothetical protein [Chloroflexi bacterium AL-N15]
MAFWKRTGRSQEQEGLNAWDRATKSMAVSASRRGFLKKLPALGAGLGLGLGVTSIASAVQCRNGDEEFRTIKSSCSVCDGVSRKRSVRTDIRRCQNGTWGPWDTLPGSRYCEVCFT